MRMIVGLFRHAVGIGDFTIDRMAKPKDRAPLRKVFKVAGVNHLAHIGGHPNMVKLDTGGGVCDLDHGRNGNPERKPVCNAAPAIFPKIVTGPIAHLAHCFENLDRHVMAHQADTFHQRVRACGVDHLVQKRLIHKGIRRGPDRPP